MKLLILAVGAAGLMAAEASGHIAPMPQGINSSGKAMAAGFYAYDRDKDLPPNVRPEATRCGEKLKIVGSERDLFKETWVYAAGRRSAVFILSPAAKITGCQIIVQNRHLDRKLYQTRIPEYYVADIKPCPNPTGKNHWSGCKDRIAFGVRTRCKSTGSFFASWGDCVVVEGRARGFRISRFDQSDEVIFDSNWSLDYLDPNASIDPAVFGPTTPQASDRP